VNGAAGTISATGTVASLVINTGSNVFTNSGLIEAVGPAGLQISYTAIANGTAGIISAAGGDVYLNVATIQGGTLTFTGAGVFVDQNNSTLDASVNPLINDATIDISNNTALYAIGTLTNAGTLALQSGQNTTQLIVGPSGTAGTFTLTGGGQVTISDNSANYIQAETTGNTLVNLNNTISGAGTIGNGDLIVINDATIDATGTNYTMVLDPQGIMTNNALIEATGAAGLNIYYTTVNNGTTGTISAATNITLQSTTIEGGVLIGSGGYSSISSSTLEGVTNKSSIVDENNNNLYLAGTITNQGTITVDSGNNTTQLILGPSGTTGTLTLTGGGQVIISDNNNNYIDAQTSGNTLLNLNNTISGAGTLGNGSLIIINDATIDATGNNTMVLDPLGTMTNNALIEATGTGGMDIYSTTVNSGTAGTISAATNITLQSSTIEGGVLTGAGGFSAISSSTLDGLTNAVINKSSIVLENNNNLYLEGTINNQGTITVDSTNNNTQLFIESPTVTLTGGGTLVISNNSNNYVQATTTGYVLDNVNNTIEGGGNFGQGNMGLTNGGLIDADDSTTLAVNLTGAVLNTSTGTLLASGSGGMAIQGGTYTNDGVFRANDGSTLSFQNSATLTNDSATGTLIGGTYAAYAAGHGATLSLAGTAVTLLDATAILSGAGAAISFGGTAIETKLDGIDRAGALEVLNDADYTTTEKITSDGTIMLGGGTFIAKSINDKATAELVGFGIVDATLASAGTLEATGLLILEKNNTISGTVSGTGTLELDKHVTTLDSGTVLDVSKVALITGASLNLATAISFAGTLTITGKDADLINGTGSFANAGLFEQDTSATTTVSAAFSNSGTVEIAAGTLAFTGGLASTGTILDKATLTDTAALTGGTLTVDGAAATASIATTAGAGNSTLAVLNLEAGGTLNTNGTTLTVTSDYTNSATGKGNAYNPFAGVTGTIDGQGAALDVKGVRGTQITTVNGTLTITIDPGTTAYFEIENTGAAGAADITGALQTSVNGGHITSPGLTGSGVTAANFAVIAAGGHSTAYAITYSSGTLTDQAIHLISDFANVAGLTIDIVAGTGSAKPPANASAIPHDPSPTAVPWLHIGSSHWG
jgi:hypothetical protein